MSWEEKINNIQFSITTGDGKQFFPLWKTGETSKEFNTSTFDFIDVQKSLVERKRPKSGKFPFTFWFDGEKHLENSDDFYNAADDSRVWTITHPYYGTIKGQPISISRNDTNLNITEFTVDFWESIDVDYPNSNFNVKDNTLVKKDAVLESCAASYSSNNVFKSQDITKNKESNVLTQSSFTEIQTNETNAEYQNAFSNAQKANDNLLDDPLTAIQRTQAIMDLPSSFTIPALNRAKAYLRAFGKLKKTFEGISDKLFFESQAGTCIASYCYSAVNFLDGDYEIVPDVELVSNDLVILYNDYLSILDSGSVSIYDIDNNWNPDPIVQSNLNDLVLYTLGNLYNLAFEAQQERIVYTDKDTNLFLLTHRYLGLDALDENIERFRIINDIKLNELFKIKKNRKIKYYV
jgi:hypothetical protein